MADDPARSARPPAGPQPGSVLGTHQLVRCRPEVERLFSHLITLYKLQFSTTAPFHTFCYWTLPDLSSTPLLSSSLYYLEFKSLSLIPEPLFTTRDFCPPDKPTGSASALGGSRRWRRGSRVIRRRGGWVKSRCREVMGTPSRSARSTSRSRLSSHGYSCMSRRDTSTSRPGQASERGIPGRGGGFLFFGGLGGARGGREGGGGGWGRGGVFLCMGGEVVGLFFLVGWGGVWWGGGGLARRLFFSSSFAALTGAASQPVCQLGSAGGCLACREDRSRSGPRRRPGGRMTPAAACP